MAPLPTIRWSGKFPPEITILFYLKILSKPFGVEAQTNLNESQSANLKLTSPVRGLIILSCLLHDSIPGGVWSLPVY